MRNDIIVAVVVSAVGYTIVATVLKLIWKGIRIRVLGLKPVGLDEEQLARTVAYCPKEFVRSAKELHPEYRDVSEEEERKLLVDMEKYTSFVVMHYVDSAKA